MRTIKFIRHTDPAKEGGPGYKLGDVVSVEPSIARRWLVRNAAVAFEPVKAEPPKYQDPKPVIGDVAGGVMLQRLPDEHTKAPEPFADEPKRGPGRPPKAKD
jgi:hypothetical protein